MGQTIETDDDLLKRLVAVVGAERFGRARQFQMESASDESAKEWFDVIWEIYEALNEWRESGHTRAQTVAVLYAQAPSYTVLNQGLRILQRYEDLDREARSLVVESASALPHRAG